MSEAFTLVGSAIPDDSGKIDERDTTRVDFPVVESGFLVGMFAYDPETKLLRHAAARVLSETEFHGRLLPEALAQVISQLINDRRKVMTDRASATLAGLTTPPHAGKLWVPGMPT